jgi:hypothetical protein
MFAQPAHRLVVALRRWGPCLRSQLLPGDGAVRFRAVRDTPRRWRDSRRARCSLPDRASRRPAPAPHAAWFRSTDAVSRAGPPSPPGPDST